MSQASISPSLDSTEKLRASKASRWNIWHRLNPTPSSVSKAQAPTYLRLLLLKRAENDAQLRYLDFCHRDLTTTTRRGVVAKDLWITGPAGLVCPSLEHDTVADDLDGLRTQLQDVIYCRSTIFAFSTSMEAIYMPWILALGLSHKGNFNLTIEGLVLEILDDQWPASHVPLTLAVEALRHPSPPFWQPTFPSQIHATAVCHGIVPDFEIKWMLESSALNKSFGMIDWSLYISEPFADKPCMDTVRVVDVTPTGADNRRIALIASSHRPLTSVRLQYEWATQNTGTAELLEYQIHTLLYALMRTIKADTVSYIRERITKVDEIDMKSRRDPSATKVQYLLHVKECHVSCAQACRDNAKLARKFCDGIELPACRYVTSIRDEMLAISTDLIYLAETLDHATVQIDKVKALVVEQMELFDKRRSRVIGMLIAVYVPLAFATSFFGMNIADTSISGYWSNSTSRHGEWNVSVPFMIDDDDYNSFQRYNKTLSESGHYEDLIMNATLYEGLEWEMPWSAWLLWLQQQDANATADSTFVSYTSTNIPGTRAWPFWMFWVVAGTLVLGSIVIPVIGGRVFRLTSRLVIKYRRTFRAATSSLYFMLLSFTYGSIIHNLNRWRSSEEMMPLLYSLDGIGIIALIWSAVFRYRTRRYWSFWGRLLLASSTVLRYPVVLSRSRDEVNPVGIYIAMYVLVGAGWLIIFGRWIFAPVKKR